MDLSIIIINWNSAHFLEGCLNSIYKWVSGIEFEVIVVDNASYDGSAQILREQFPDATFIQSERNLGFSKANNLACQRSSGNTLLFLNPDTEVLDDGVAKMYTHLNSAAAVGAVGCRVVNSDLTLQTKYVKAFPTILNQLLTADVAIRLFPKSKLWGFRPAMEFQGQPLDVDVLAGSCIMVKRSVFEQIGRFNEEFFMYVEDVDLCYMIKKAGYAIQYVGDGTVVHHSEKSSASANESHFSSVMQRESMALFFRCRRGSSYSGLYKVTTAVAAFVRIALLGCILPFAKVWRQDTRISAGCAKWAKLLRWSFGLERWASVAGSHDKMAAPSRYSR
jgi:GT2 family glycosyltransferase